MQTIRETMRCSRQAHTVDQETTSCSSGTDTMCVIMLPVVSLNVYTYLAGQPFRSTRPRLTSPDMDDQAV